MVRFLKFSLRQRDQLSPYLFLFVADGLARILDKESHEGRITPLKIAHGTPGISNLLFADDSLLFFIASRDQAKVVRDSLDIFQRCPGQLSSNNKRLLLFSDCCSEQVQQEIKLVQGVRTSTFESKYLGLPTPVGRMKDEQFQPIMERFTNRCFDWSERFMSYAAQEVQVKSVVQAILTYVMGVFKMSQNFCQKYEKLITDFLWGDEVGRRKVHWMA